MANFLKELFSPIGGDDAYRDTGAIYKDVLGHNGAVQNLDDLPTVVEAAVGTGGAVDELTSGDGLGVQHLIGSESIVGDLLGTDG